MKHYIYRFTVYVVEYNEAYGKIGRKIKAFLGNDESELYERFELWFIKQGYDRADIETRVDFVQHANN